MQDLFVVELCKETLTEAKRTWPSLIDLDFLQEFVSQGLISKRDAMRIVEVEK